MRDRLLLCAVVISVFAHLGVVCIIGGTSATRMNAASLAVPQRLITVDVIKDPFQSPTATPEPAIEIEPPRDPRPTVKKPDEPTQPPRNDTGKSRDPGPSATGTDPPGDPGGPLNSGSPSAHGDLPVTPRNGNTPPGWVPSANNGTGTGSGNSPGTGTADPVTNATAGPNLLPSPGPPPAPATVEVQVCKVSGLPPGKHCKSTRVKSFVEGKQPSKRCDQCKAPEHVSTLADRKNPELVKDVQPRIPDSLDEGLSLSVTVEYWVEKDGTVTGAKIVKPSGNRQLDRNVTSAALMRKYKPAVQNGVPRRATVKWSVTVNT